MDRSFDAGACLTWWRGLPEAERALLFDAGFYRQQLDATEPAPEDLIHHYVMVGASRRLSPNPLFEPYSYIEQRGDLGQLSDPFCHYLLQGWREELSPHPLLPGRPEMTDISAKSNCGPLLALLQAVEARRPEPPARRRSTAADAVGSAIWFRHCRAVVLAAPLQRAIRVLVRSFPSYAAVAEALEKTFDYRFYSSQLRRLNVEVGRLDLLVHYAAIGHKAGLRPHPLFDPAYYLKHSPDVTQARVEPLLHFLLMGWSEANRPINPCYKLPASDQYQRRGAKLVDPITAYIEAAPAERPLLSGAFAPDFYCRRHPEVDWSTADPLLHYLSVGALRAELPNPAFDPAYYAATAMAESQRERISPLEHFECSPFPRHKTFALFDPTYYRGHHPDLNYPDFDPATHFLQFGVWEDRRCSAIQSTRYIHASFPARSFADCPPIGAYLSEGAQRRKRFVFVGHEASRTGAPRILLRLVQYFASHDEIECISILDQAGPLVPEYAKVSHVVVPEKHRLRLYSGEISEGEFQAELDGIMEQFADNPPLGVICNCAEVRAYAKYFRRYEIPIIFLMHELAELYPASELVRLADNSDVLVFPAQFVAEGFLKAVPLDAWRYRVLPQGLLRDDFGSVPRDSRADLFKRWNLAVPQDAFIVLGCGTIDGRKGFDHFIEVARRVRNADPEASIRFIWVGGRTNWRLNDGAQWDSTAYWSSWELQRHKLQDDVLVVPEVADPEPFFLCADVFLLTSRADPFPCVVHEAMACRLPVIGFSGTGGAPEAFLPDAGILVDYPDTGAMAEGVLSLAVDQARRTQMGSTGRARIESLYRFEPYAEQIKQVMAGEDPAPWIGVSAPKPRRTGPRVYLTTPTWSLSGVNTFAEALVRYLNEHGFEAEILITRGRFGPVRPNGKFYEPEPETLPGAPYRMLQPADLSERARQDAVRDFLLANAPCVLIPNFDYAISELARELPDTVSVLGILHSDDGEHYDHCYQLAPFWDRIVAVSNTIASNVAALNPAFDAKLATIRYGVEPPPSEVLATSIQLRRASAAPIRLLYAGRFEKTQKRILDYVRLAQQLAADNVDFHLDLLGEGTQLEAVRAALAPLIMAGRVDVPGRLDHAEVLERMRRAHVVLVLSDFEGLPLCLVEGMQNGCIPVVTAMRSGIPEVIDDGVNGFIVPVGDLAAVGAHIRRLQEEPTVRASMMRSALATPERRKLTSAAMGESYAALLAAMLADKAVGKGRRPALSYLQAITQSAEA